VKSDLKLNVPGKKEFHIPLIIANEMLRRIYPVIALIMVFNCTSRLTKIDFNKNPDRVIK
jgi:hypothetical protein